VSRFYEVFGECRIVVVGTRQVNVHGVKREKTKMELGQPVGRSGQDAFSSDRLKKIHDNNEVGHHLGKTKQKRREKVAEHKLASEARRMNFEIGILQRKLPSIFSAGQASERGSLVTSASEEEILKIT